MDKQQIQKRLKDLPGLIKEANAAVKEIEAERKIAQNNKEQLEKEFRHLDKSTNKFKN